MLSICGLEEDQNCCFCKTEIKDMLCLFWFCPHVVTFWMTLKKWLVLYCILLTMCPLTITLGELRNGCPNVLNTVILLGKRFIFELDGKESFSLF